MSKQGAKGDLFGMPADDSDQEGAEIGDYVLVQLIAADGWKAIFMDAPAVYRTLGLAGFALVEFIPDNPEVAQIPSRAVRPMVVDEFGEIEDVASFEEFLCVVPPNQNAQEIIDRALERRERETAK